MPQDYLPASKGQYSWGDETTPYTKATTSANYFGLLRSDVDFPNPNTKQPMATGGGRRGPHVNANLEKEYPFTVEFEVLDHMAPFHAALGQLTTTAKDPDSTPGSGDEYDEHLFTETDVLPPITVQHDQDGQLQEHFIGAKADLSLSASVGEALRASMAFLAASKVKDTGTPSAPALSVPVQEPFMFHQKVDVDLINPDTEAVIKSLATINGFNLNWSNGLEARHHGSSREAHTVVETEAENKYDMSLEMTIIDMDVYNRAFDDDVAVDVSIPLHRTTSPVTDACIITLQDADVVDAMIPFKASGSVDAEFKVMPLNTSIEVRTPT